jgi:hypothetical protein
MQETLPSFRETRYGYAATSRDDEHTYTITWNSIDYTVTHYWSQNPNGELVDTTPNIAFAPRIARNHYDSLLNQEGK